jgi:4-amino-4-deoxy-L-arabinose transferase-like glycosyltransferase
MSRRQVRPWLRRGASSRWTWIVGLGALALVVRLVALSSAFDIFIDEISYTNISLSVAHGGGVTLYGQPFALHPPAAFGLYAAVIVVLGLHGDTESVLLALRNVDAVLGSATCVVTFLLVDRMARRRVAVVAALLIALDPLAISYGSRVMLEAPAQLAAVSMFLFLVLADEAPRGTAWRLRWLIAAGVAGGVVLTTKETFGLVVLLALALLVATGWVVARWEAVLVIGLTLLGYAISVVALGLSIGFGVWWNAKVGGALRLVGANQISGFNAPQTRVSFLARILANGPTLAVTYLVLATGSVSALVLVWWLEPWKARRRGRHHRGRAKVLVAIWTMSAAAYLAYATLFGTIEEQMYYILLLPCVISVCLVTAGVAGHVGRRWRAVVVVVVGMALLVDSVVWVGVHGGRDDEYRRMLSWEAVHVPPTAVVSATDGTSQFLMSRGIIGQWGTVAQLEAHHVDYVVIATLLVDQGYGIAGPSFEQKVERGGRVVFAADGVSDGSLRIYDVRSMTGASR